MNVRLAAQTLSSSVANAIDFLDKSARLNFSESNGTVKFIRTIDRLFDMLKVLRHLFEFQVRTHGKKYYYQQQNIYCH